MVCAFFPDHVRAIVGDEKACGPAGKIGEATANMTTAQLLLIVDNNEAYLYRDQRSWFIRTGRTTPPVHSEVFPTAILSPDELALGWKTLRVAQIDRARLFLANAGYATAEDVRIAAPPGYKPAIEGPAIPPHTDVARDYSSPAMGADRWRLISLWFGRMELRPSERASLLLLQGWESSSR